MYITVGFIDGGKGVLKYLEETNNLLHKVATNTPGHQRESNVWPHRKMSIPVPTASYNHEELGFLIKYFPI
jgi:hypothetical protein